ncbi:Sodium:proline symporter [Planctomycetales bacterium 10988]|nr:Sodium:proline symporter [Planctomycetales bacterium 10988]
MTQLYIIGGYLVLLLMLGLFSNRLFKGTSKDYMLASHSIGPFLLLMSLFGTTMTAFALVGSTGEAFTEGIGVYGMLASSSGIIHSLCFFLIGIRLWSFGRRYGYTTQIQFFRDRLENEGIGLLLFPILVGLVIPYLLIGVLAAGAVINGVTIGAFDTAFARYDFGVPPWLGSLVISVIVLLYVFFGGMRGTAWANAFQTMVFMVLGIVTFFIISNQIGGVQAASEAVLEKHPSKMMREVPPEEHATYEEEFERWEVVAKYNWAKNQPEFAPEIKAALTEEKEKEFADEAASRPGPPFMRPFIQEALEAEYAKEQGLLNLSPEQTQIAKIEQDDRILPPEGQRAADWVNLPLAHFAQSDDWVKEALTTYADEIGHVRLEENKITRNAALGRYRVTHWAPQEPERMSFLLFVTYLLIPFSVGMFPHLFQHWLTAKSAGSFKLPVVAHPIFIMIVWVPCVLLGVWATSATYPGTERLIIPPHFPANAVLARMVSELTDDVLAGFLTAGVLAAIMSSLDSQFLAIGTMFTTDIVTHYTGEDRFTDRQKVWLARGFVILIVAVTYGCSLFEPRRVFILGVWCFSGFSSLFPLVFAAVYWKRLTAAGAYAGALAAIISWLWLFADSNFGLDAEYTFFGMMPVVPMVAAAIVAMVLVSLVTKPPSQATIDKFFALEAEK